MTDPDRDKGSAKPVRSTNWHLYRPTGPWQPPQPAGKRTYAYPDYYKGKFLGRVLVVCPRCEGPGVVTWSMEDPWYGGIRCTCGYAKNPEGDWARIQDYPLWIQANFRGHTLWATNWDHLAFLEDAIAAELRTGSPRGQRGNRAVLPKWMLLAKNREGLLRVIQRLRAQKMRVVEPTPEVLARKAVGAPRSKRMPRWNKAVKR